jgi:hypothetical protein
MTRRIVTIRTANPDTRAAAAEAEIVVKAMEGFLPVSRSEAGDTITIEFRRA